jgi:eukaryotic-like serine/threonine-protein kinase
MAPELLLGARPSEQSDMFSFCVSLWEALHGCRPFPGRAPSGGALAPRRTRPVPRWLDRALVRGLAIDPSARWPTMRELVTVLRETPRRRRAARWTTGIVLSVVVAGGLGRALNRGPSCAERAQDLDAMWSTAHKDAIEATWRAGPPFVRESWPAVRDRLDGWATAWVGVQQQACVATFEERTRSEVAFDRTMACLDRRRSALGSTTELLASGRPEVVAAAGPMLDALAHPSSCVEEPLSVGTALPSPPAPEAAAIARGIDRARLLVAAGDPAAALTELEASAAQLGEHPSLAAEHQLVRGRALLVAGEWDAASGALSQAGPSALLRSDDALAAEAFVTLAELEVERQRYDEARRWHALADAEQQRAQAPPRERARLRDVEGSIAFRTGDAEGAEQRHREALALLADTAAGDSLAFTIRRHIGISLAARGRYEAAEAIFTGLASDVEATFGAMHPDLGTIAKNLAIDARERGELRVALAHAERAHRVLVEAFGAGSIRVAETLTLLADLRSELGEPEEVIPMAEAAWRLQRARLPPGHSERGSALALLAWLQLRSGDFEAALASNRELEREYQEGQHRAELPTVSHDIGVCLCALGRCSEAYDRFVTLHEQLGDDAPLKPYAASGLALAELSRGQCDRGEVRATRTLDGVLAAASEDADLRAELRLIIAACRLGAGDGAGAVARAREAAADQPSSEVRRFFHPDVIALLDAG